MLTLVSLVSLVNKVKLVNNQLSKKIVFMFDHTINQGDIESLICSKITHQNSEK